jgi:hypothetical protein
MEQILEYSQLSFFLPKFSQKKKTISKTEKFPSVPSKKINKIKEEQKKKFVYTYIFSEGYFFFHEVRKKK